MGKLLFGLTSAQDIAAGASIYTNIVFKKAIETGNLFDAYYNPDIKKNTSLMKHVPQHVSLHKCSNITELEKLLESGQFDTVFFGNGIDTSAKLPENVTPVIVVHDLRFIEVPNDKTRYLYRNSFFDRLKQIVISKLSPTYDALRQKKQIAHFIDNPRLKIVTVSNHTKYSILLNYPQIKEYQIRVLTSPNPVIDAAKDIAKGCDALGKIAVRPKEYFLIISGGRWFKNSYRAIQALDDLISKKLLKNKKVLVLGVKEGLKIAQVNNPKHFVFRDYVENDTLLCAYKNAYCFIYPSLQEGFGTPPLEAMQYGTPVLAASDSAIHETCGTGANYFNPYSVMEIENRILYLLNDKTFYERLCKSGIERSKEIAEKQKIDLDKLIKLLFE